MSSKRRGLVISVVFAIVWLFMLLAGADHPPPVGFLALLPFLGFAALLVYRRAIAYAGWKASAKPNSMFLALIEGAGAGLAIAAAISVLPWMGEPGVRFSTEAFGIWLGVASALGSLSAALVYLLSGGHDSVRQQTLAAKRAPTFPRSPR
jgi:hypothetical protein